jgi:hypothetical protein
MVARPLKYGLTNSSRLARASARGFDTNNVWYHGTSADIQKIDPSYYASGNLGRENAFFLTKSPDDAEFYAKMKGRNHTIYPFYAQTDGMKSVNYRNEFDEYHDLYRRESLPDEFMPYDTYFDPLKYPEADLVYDANIMNRIFDRYGGGKSLKIEGIKTNPGTDPTDYLAVFDPTSVKSAYGRFKQQPGASRNIMAGSLPYALPLGLSAGLLAYPPNHDQD